MSIFAKSLVGVAVLAGLAVVAATPSEATIINTVSSNGYAFTNFDPTLTVGTAVGSNVNGISNAGQVVGTQVDANNASVFANFTGTPASTTALNTGAGQIAFGVNSAGNVVGGNGTTAFYLPKGGSVQTLAVPGGAINAFGINNAGAIVGQFTSGAATPGFVLPSANSINFTTVNAPSGPNTVNAQSINNNGTVVGFYLGTDGQVHGFSANTAGAGSVVTGTAIADPTIPAIAGEPGATFVFSQILSVSDTGLAVGYYGDSTGSQHGFFYNLATGTYRFLDDPSAAFSNGVEITQITGITNTGEIAGFYTDANAVAHSFIACPAGLVCTTTAVPEPGSLPTLAVALGIVGLGGLYGRRHGRL